MSLMTRLLLTSVVVALITISAGAALAQGRAAVVLVERVEIRRLADTAPVIGRMVGTIESSVASRVAGIVSSVLFSLGDRVQKGQELVVLDDTLASLNRRTAEAALEAAKAGVVVAEARVKLADQAFARQSRLQGSAAFSQGQFEDLEQTAVVARSELLQAQAAVSQAEAALARMDYDMIHGRIVAPFDGVVVSRMAQPGQYLNIGEPIATVLDTSRLEIEADVPVDFIGSLSRGAPIDTLIAGRFEAPARVRSLLPTQNLSTQTRPVRLSVDLTTHDRAEFADGESVTVFVPISAPREAPTVPKDALVEHRGGWSVYVVEDGAARRRPVTIGAPTGDRMEVVEGLSPGETVVVRGNERLREGQPVVPKVAQAGPGTDGG